MLTQGDDVDAHALRRRGWTITAIAAHLGHDRKTIRDHLNGERIAGVRAPAVEDRFARFVDYCRARLVEDPHLWATTLFDEVVGLGFDQSYATFTRHLHVTRFLGHVQIKPWNSGSAGNGAKRTQRNDALALYCIAEPLRHQHQPAQGTHRVVTIAHPIRRREAATASGFAMFLKLCVAISALAPANASSER